MVDEEQITFSEVYIPAAVDTDVEAMTAAEIKRMAYGPKLKGQPLQIDTEHNLQPCGSVIVEDFIARKGDLDFKEGAWVLGVWHPAEIWKRIKSGELNGFSFYGDAGNVRLEKVPILQAKRLSGTTEKSEDGHDHELDLHLDADARVIPTFTGEGPDGHRHAVKRTTATEREQDHSHRLLY